MKRGNDQIGSKLGPKLAQLVSQTIIATKRGLIPHEHTVRTMATQAVIDHAGREIADLYRPIIELMLDMDDGNLHPHVREFLEQAKSGEHQLKAAAGLLMGPVQGAIGTLLSNELAPFVYRIVAGNPNLEVDPSTAANMAARGIDSYDDDAYTASRQGFASDQFKKLWQLAQSPPDVTALWELMNRNLIRDSEAVRWMRRAGYDSSVVLELLDLRKQLLSPADLALAVLRGNVTMKDGVEQASWSGVDAKDFDVLLGNTGEPPGVEQLLEALRRGFIDEHTVTRGILQSRIRNEWIPTILKLRFSPMSVSDAVNAVVQNHLSFAQGQRYATENGLEPDHFRTLYETAGEPLSRTEMENLYNRGLATEDDVKQAIRESRVKNKYIDDAFKLHTRLLPPRTISEAVQTGSLTHEAAIKRAMEYGYSRADAVILVDHGSAAKLNTYRKAVMSAIEALYERHGISEQDAKAHAKRLGFSDAEITLIFQAADFRRLEMQQNTAVSLVRSKFLARHINEREARAILASNGVIAAQQDYYIRLWSVELKTETRQLSEAQIIHAMKKKVFDLKETEKRLVNMGYSEVDAAVLIASA